MAIDSIIAQLDSEIARLNQVRSLLANSARVGDQVNGHRAGRTPARGRKKRVLSAEARKRIADAQRRRWAAQRAKSKKES